MSKQKQQSSQITFFFEKKDNREKEAISSVLNYLSSLIKSAKKNKLEIFNDKNWSIFEKKLNDLSIHNQNSILQRIFKIDLKLLKKGNSKLNKLAYKSLETHFKLL
jgi:hypothetical protein